MLKLCSCSLSILLILAGLLVPNLAIANQKQAIVNVPPDSRLSCDEAIANVKQDLTQRGFLRPLPSRRGEIVDTVRFDSNYIQEYFFDYPSDRIQRVMFVLSEVTDLYSSPKLMATLASQIMAECKYVGMVSYARWQEGIIHVGFFPDNTARNFIHTYDPSKPLANQATAYRRNVQTSNGIRSQFQWGYDFGYP
jgi:hypothetical protein